MTNPAFSLQTPISSEKSQIIFIVGPTAVGKTAVALLLAEQLNSEIVSCDAIQVYREINIASAKPSPQELEHIKHHCVNIVSVKDEFNVVKYRTAALEAIEDILKKGRPAIVVGGSGMYMSVLLDGIFQGASKDEGLRAKLQEQMNDKGIQALHEQLRVLDPKAASKIHANDSSRIIRALEVVLSTQQPISKWQEKRNGLWGKYSIKLYGLELPRPQLYQRAEERIERMFNAGLIQEVQDLLDRDVSPTSKALIGFKEVQGYLQGHYDLDRAKYLMKLHTRHYIKRQMTWFKRDQRIHWLMSEGAALDIANQIRQESCS